MTAAVRLGPSVFTSRRSSTADVERDELVQLAERALFEAEQAYGVDPSPANQRRVMRAWSELREARGEPEDSTAPPFPIVDPRRISRD